MLVPYSSNSVRVSISSDLHIVQVGHVQSEFRFQRAVF